MKEFIWRTVLIILLGINLYIISCDGLILNGLALILLSFALKEDLEF